MSLPQMDEATASHLVQIEDQIGRLEAKLTKLKDERDRIMAEWEDPLQAQADRAAAYWDERIKAHRYNHCRCTCCDRQFDTERGLTQHHRSCRDYQRWKEAHMKWVRGGRKGPAPRPAFLKEN